MFAEKRFEERSENFILRPYSDPWKRETLQGNNWNQPPSDGHNFTYNYQIEPSMEILNFRKACSLKIKNTAIITKPPTPDIKYTSKETKWRYNPHNTHNDFEKTFNNPFDYGAPRITKIFSPPTTTKMILISLSKGGINGTSGIFKVLQTYR